MTHHCPSFRCNPSGNYAGALCGAYCSELDGFIMDNPNIKWWVCGHTHVRRTFEIEQCKVLMNCRGYWQYDQMSKTFDPNTWFEVDDPVTSS